MEKTKYVLKAEVETAFVLPKTLQAQTEIMPINGALIPMYAVYGRDASERRIWVATFVDSDEAMAWVHGSKVFGRAVNGAVISNQEKDVGEETVDENATGNVAGGEPAGKPN